MMRALASLLFALVALAALALLSVGCQREQRRFSEPAAASGSPTDTRTNARLPGGPIDTGDPPDRDARDIVAYLYTLR